MYGTDIFDLMDSFFCCCCGCAVEMGPPDMTQDYFIDGTVSITNANQINRIESITIDMWDSGLIDFDSMNHLCMA